VLCCRGQGEEALAAMQSMMRKLKLTLNEAKTRLRRVPDESVDFLGYTIGRCYSPRTGGAYMGTRPSRKSVRRICRRVSELTGRRWVLLDAATEVRRINRLLMGWSNYFCLGPVSQAHRGVDAHAQHRLRQWLRAKHKVRGQGFARFPDRVLYRDLGLIRVQGRPRIYPWATA
jgi:hypothetical protein